MDNEKNIKHKLHSKHSERNNHDNNNDDNDDNNYQPVKSTKKKVKKVKSSPTKKHGKHGGYDDNDDNNDNDDNDDDNNDNDDDNDDNDDNIDQYGGKEKYTGEYRHFRVVELNGKEVKFGKSDITSKQTPLNAAKKLLKSIALHKNLKGLDKLKLGTVIYRIQETTRGAKTHGKIYGPYSGKYQKYSAEEMKKAMASGQTFSMKPIVSKAKVNQKGGYKL
jgi:hypothetical protein